MFLIKVKIYFPIQKGGQILYILVGLICPLIILITGYLLKSFPPKDINGLNGYKTKMSRKNIKTWNEANEYSTKLLIKFSWLALLISVVSSLVLGKSYIIVEVFISMFLIIISLIALVELTEKHLKNVFGE